MRVVQYGVTFDADFNATTTQEPAAGATVTAAGRTFTTGADGVAQVTIDGRSVTGVRATKAGYVRSATENVCVDCGPSYVPPRARRRRPGRDGQLRAQRRRLLAQARAAAAARQRGRRPVRAALGEAQADPPGRQACAYFSGRRERFRKMRCGRGSFLRIGDRADWSYLLPKRLGRGRYVLEVKAIDGAFNRGAVERVPFRVK